MQIFPAIDLWDGRAVRLEPENGDAMTFYSAQACGIARRFIRAGARYLHITDLEGARAGEPGFANLIEIEALAHQGNAFLQVGGGIRTEEHIRRYLDMGLDRVVLDAGVDPAFVRRMAARYGGNVAVYVDGGEDAAEVCRRIREAGVQTVVCTGIAPDAAAELCREAKGILVCGAGSLRELRMLRDAGADGVILGAPVCDGRLDLGMCLEAAGERRAPEDDELPLF